MAGTTEGLEPGGKPRSARKTPAKSGKPPGKPARPSSGTQVRDGGNGRKLLASAADPRQLRMAGIDSPLAGDIQNGKQIMMFSFFAQTLCKKDPITELPTYDDGQTRIEVRGTKIGIATTDDAEILLFCLGLAGDKLARGEKVGQEFSFTLRDYCEFTGLKQGGSVSRKIGDALERLKETNIQTNIEAGGKIFVEGFSWIEKYWYDRGSDKVIDGRKRKGRINSITVRVCDFLWRAIVIDRNLLSYNRDFLALSPIKRRLYEIARVHCNDRPAFRIGLESLRDRVGTAQELKNFKDELAKMLESEGSPLLGYRFRIDTGQPQSKRPRLNKVAVEFWREDHDIAGFGDIPLIDETYLADLRVA
jgi:Replication initiator protein A